MAEGEDRKKVGHLRNHQKSHLDKLMADPVSGRYTGIYLAIICMVRSWYLAA